MPSASRRLPRIPRLLLEQHAVFVATDAPFTAAARLLQSLWRSERGFAIGTAHNRLLGSQLTPADGLRGANFLSPEVAAFVRRELALLDRAARSDRDRLFRNLLASPALGFNLFGALTLAPTAARAFFSALAPDLVTEVTDVVFEHAPGRSAPRLTGDKTTFDVFVRGQDAARATTHVAMEVKYAETLRRETATPRLSFDRIAAQSGLFRDPAAPALRVAPLQQIWREHLLSRALTGEDRPYARGRFIFVAPQLNGACWAAVDVYAAHLVSTDPIVTGFQAVTLEDCLARLVVAGAADLATALHARYLDFERVIDLIVAGPARGDRDE